MEFFKIRRVIPFMRHALVFNVISLITFLLAVGFLAFKGLNFSVEFTGGTLIEVNYKASGDVQKVRETLEQAGLKVEVQTFGSSRDVLIRMPLDKGQSSADLSQRVGELLKAQDASAELRRVEYVGPQVGEELAEYGALALLIFGSGPVRGFAVVHCLGILTSMFSSVIVSRAIVNLYYGHRRKVARLQIGNTAWK